jgi:Ca2+-binding RTX toxin-like protein
MRHRGKTAAALVGVGLWLAFLAAPQSGLAKIRCQRGSGGAVLSVSATDDTYAGLRRKGEEIAVFDVLTRQRKCKTGATVANTDQIKIFAGPSASAFVAMAKGPFAPGLSPDEDSSPEIEMEASGPGYVAVIGTPAPDHYRFLDAGLQSGVNLNPEEDKDVDVAVARNSREEMLFVVEGAGGNDRIDAKGAPALEMFAGGGDGKDTLVSASTGAILEGERGADRLIGGPGFDLIVPGRGADRVTAAGGSDLIEMSPDRSRDRINCGPGFDLVAGGDRFDRLTACP